MLDGVIDGYQAYEAAVADCPAEPIADESAGGDMLYSSGTTGRPKGVFVPPESTDIAYVNSLLKVCMGPFAMGPDTVYLSPGPLYHAAPLRFAMAVMRLGGTVVVMEHFDAAEFLRLVALHRITPHAGGADDVRAHAQAARRAAPGARPVVACASPSMPRRRARCR